MRRILTAAVLIPAIISLVLWGPPYLLTAVGLLITEAALWEFFRLAEGAGFNVLRVPGYIFGGAIALQSFFSPVGPLKRFLSPWEALLILPIALFVWAMLSYRNLSDFLGSVSATLLGLAYVSVPLSVLVYLILLGRSTARLVLFGLVVIWAGDSMGFFVGRYWGRHKIAPGISPGKSWEGTAASFAAAIIVGLFFILFTFGVVDSQLEEHRYYSWIGFSWSEPEGLGRGLLELAVLAAVINIAGQLGDLAESALKRNAGVKDSSNLVPGHGGVLDRIDALLFAAPVLWYYWIWRLS